MKPFKSLQAFILGLMSTRPAYYDWLFNVSSNGRIFRVSVLEAAKLLDVELAHKDIFELKRYFNNIKNKTSNPFKETVIQQNAHTLNKELFDK